MKISLLYTSRRAHLINRVVDTWIAAARDKYQVEFVFTADEDDLDTAVIMLRKQQELTKAGLLAVGPLVVGPPGSCVSGWNLAAKNSTGDLLIAISDDFSPPMDYDYHLRTLGRDGWWEQEAVILVKDGMERENICVTLPIITRPRYDRLGYVFHPDYLSMWADNELGEHAQADGVLYQSSIEFRHAHFVNGQREADSVDRKHSSKTRYDQGRRLFEVRRSLGFPAPSGSLEPRTDVFRPIAYILTTGDDFSILEAVQRLTNEGVEDFFFAIPDELWNGVRNSAAQDTESLIQDMSTVGYTVYRQSVNLRNYRGQNLTFTDVEARVRNSALEQMSGLGYRDVLIVDDDEIWTPGLLNQVHALVQSERPLAIHADCVPVVGVPGLLIEGAKDRVGIYVDAARNRFAEGRGFYKNGGSITGYPVYHFTATRRSRKEVADKMLTSAHFDDLDYGFRQWIAQRLPNLKPGERNVHMFTKGVNIWPLARAWTPEEVKRIPESLREYLWTQ